ncbi:hypothetical protein TNCV_4455081 [Trichonephila clavipes]|nr:hypothetical protein TNCV_4455081 [Trichonephila clavipes]
MYLEAQWLNGSVLRFHATGPGFKPQGGQAIDCGMPSTRHESEQYILLNGTKYWGSCSSQVRRGRNLLGVQRGWNVVNPRIGLRRTQTATAGSDVVQSGRPIFDDFFQHLRPYIGNNTANVIFQMVKRLWLIRIDQ